MLLLHENMSFHGSCIPAPRDPSAADQPAATGWPWRVAVLLLVLLATAACDSRFPLDYMRNALRPEGMRFALGEVTRPTGSASLTGDLPPPVSVGWDSIVARDTLVALLTFNSTGFFIHRGEPLGYEYELLSAFADHHELEFRTEVVRQRTELFRRLNRGEGDVVAARLVDIPEYRDAVEFTAPLYETRPVVVQRSGDPVPRAATDTTGGRARTGVTPPDTLKESVPGDTAGIMIPEAPGDLTAPVEIRARLLQRPSELAGTEVHLPAGSDYWDQIVELSDSLGERIELVEVQNAEQIEPLIQAVAEGRIRLTVSPENLADLNVARFANISATPVLGPAAPTVWAVRKNAPELRRRLDAFLRSDAAQVLNRTLYAKYFVDRQAYQERVEVDILAHESGRISPYDSLLESGAQELGWDWRLLAAQVAQESRFDPGARSWAGAQGLLQLMPRTAREMGVSNPNDPAQSVAGGVRYLIWLSGLWQEEIPDEEERLKFILASYNAGRGHVLDAQRLAAKHGDDPMKWEDVAYWLLQKSKSSVYRDPVVQHGYVRGLEPVQYVSKILQRYDRYRNLE